jgi:hypothetical protein
MKLRFEQPNIQCGQKSERLPSGVPAPWVIDKIRKKPPMVDRPQPRLEIDDMPPPGYRPERKPPEESERGVVIIEF